MRKTPRVEKFGGFRLGQEEPLVGWVCRARLRRASLLSIRTCLGVSASALRAFHAVRAHVARLPESRDSQDSPYPTRTPPLEQKSHLGSNSRISRFLLCEWAVPLPDPELWGHSMLRHATTNCPSPILSTPPTHRIATHRAALTYVSQQHVGPRRTMSGPWGGHTTRGATTATRPEICHRQCSSTQISAC